MHALRLSLVTLVFLGSAYFLGKEIVVGLKTGKIAYSKSGRHCHRLHNPAGFWLLVVLFSGIVLMMFAVWLRVVLPAVAPRQSSNGSTVTCRPHRNASATNCSGVTSTSLRPAAMRSAK